MSSAAHFASRASRVEDAIAFRVDRSMGRLGAPEYCRDVAITADAIQTVRRTEPAVGTRKVVPMTRPAIVAPATVLKKADPVIVAAKAAETKRLAEIEAARKVEEARVIAERERRELIVARDELIELVYHTDIEVFRLVWSNDPTITHRYLDVIINEAPIGRVKVIRSLIESGIERHRAAKAQAEAKRRDDEAARLNAPVGRDTINPIAKAFGQKQGSGDAQQPGKKGAFNVLDYLRTNAATPVPVAPVPSKEDLAALGRRINGEKEQKQVILVTIDSKRTLRDRILALSPVTIATLHAEKPEIYIRCGYPVRLELFTHTWPSIDRLLNALQSAKAKVEGRVVEDASAIARIETFVAWCEQS